MNVSYLLALFALGAFGVAVWALIWVIDAGRYDDVEATGNLALDHEDPAE